MDLLLNLDTSSDECVPLYKRLAMAIREAILDGRIKPGQAVPSTRRLAELSDVCRATAIKAYEDLLCEGFITSDAGKGTFVCDPLPRSTDCSRSAVKSACGFSSTLATTDHSFELSDFVNRLDGFASESVAANGAIDPNLANRWKRLTLKSCRIETLSSLAGSDAQKNRITYLKFVLKNYLLRSRAVYSTNEQIAICPSKEYLLYLVSRILLGPGDRVVVGDGCPPWVRAIFKAQGAELIECPVDQGGLVVHELRYSMIRDQLKPRYIYVNPSSHQPTGEVMTLARRLQLLAFAGECGAYILEDDVDSEFRYGNQALLAVHRLSKEDNVFYVSSLSQLLAPLAKVALMVIPNSFVSEFNVLAADEDISSVTSAVISRIIEDGHLELYIKQRRQHHARLKQKLTYCVTRKMLKTAKIVTQSASNRQVLRIDSQMNVADLVKQAALCGLGFEDTTDFYTVASQYKDISIYLDQVEDDEFDSKLEAFASRLLEIRD